MIETNIEAYLLASVREDFAERTFRPVASSSGLEFHVSIAAGTPLAVLVDRQLLEQTKNLLAAQVHQSSCARRAKGRLASSSSSKYSCSSVSIRTARENLRGVPASRFVNSPARRCRAIRN